MRKKLKPKKNNFDLKKRIIIIADGETEKSYIKMMNEKAILKNINLKYEKGNEDNFEIKFKENIDIPIYLILDLDNCEVKTSDCKKKKKIQKLTDKFDKKVFYNNFSIETWLLNIKYFFQKRLSIKNIR